MWYILNEFPDKVRSSPAILVSIIIPKGPYGFHSLNILHEILMIWLLRGTENMCLCIFKAEYELNILMVDQGFEFPGNVFCVLRQITQGSAGDPYPAGQLMNYLAVEQRFFFLPQQEGSLA